VGNNVQRDNAQESFLPIKFFGNGRFFPDRDVTWLQRSCATACNRFLHSRGGYVGSIIRRYRIL